MRQLAWHRIPRQGRKGIDRQSLVTYLTHSLPHTRSYILMEVKILFFLLLLFRVCPELAPKWFKFDDGEVSECKMDDDEVLVTCWCIYSFSYSFICGFLSFFSVRGLYFCVTAVFLLVADGVFNLLPGVEDSVFWWGVHGRSVWPYAKKVRPILNVLLWPFHNFKMAVIRSVN